MTRDEIVQRVADRLNLTSTTALDRIADDVVDVYKRVLRAVGLATSTQGITSAQTVIAYRYVTFTGLQKLYTVYSPNLRNGRPLSLVTPDEMRNMTALDGDQPRAYAVTGQTHDTVTVWLDSTPETVYTLYADALLDAATLTANDQPVFPEHFHEILIHGAKEIELRKMEKKQLADDAMDDYERMLGELRLYLALTAYRQLYQGKHSSSIVRV